MKRMGLTFVLALVVALSLSQIAHANMGPPRQADVGSSITFEQNDTVSVLSEVLDIIVDGSEANIVATYKMKNITGKNVSTQSMFLSPNMKYSDIKVVVNSKDVSFTVKSYALYYDTEIKLEKWQYAVLVNEELASHNVEQTVDAIAFEMDFAPYEEYDVIVSYTYRLGGYPDLDFDVKMGRIEYYLTPAAMWNGFRDIKINLYLDEDMPVIWSSNLKFKKMDTRTYQYASDTLPEGNLEIVIDENGWQTFFSRLRSPYFLMILKIFLPFILIPLAVVAVIVWYLRRRKKRKS